MQLAVAATTLTVIEMRFYPVQIHQIPRTSVVEVVGIEVDLGGIAVYLAFGVRSRRYRDLAG